MIMKDSFMFSTLKTKECCLSFPLKTFFSILLHSSPFYAPQMQSYPVRTMSGLPFFCHNDTKYVLIPLGEGNYFRRSLKNINKRISYIRLPKPPPLPPHSHLHLRIPDTNA